MRRFLLCCFPCLLLVGTAAAYSPDVVSQTYLFAGTVGSYDQRITRTGGNVDIVCPDFFEPTADGSLAVLDKTNAVFIAAQQRKGIKVLPNINNHWSRAVGRAVIANAPAFAAQVSQAVSNHNLDGIDLDIQNITEADRAGFTNLVKQLRQALPAGKLLHICVAANPWGTNLGWQGAYDYAALAPYCDAIFIMTYDESYESGPAGPVASYSFIEKSVQYALTKVPANKIMLGLPFYGRYWKAGDSYGGKALTVNDIENLCARYTAKTWYDATKQCARATLTLSANDVAAGLWGGKNLSPGSYDIWYENAKSYQAKLALVDKYKLKGVGSWALGQEPEWLWSNYRAWLKGLPFNDINNSWAEPYIVALYDRGLVNGQTATTYAPTKTLTRAEATVLVMRLLGLSPTHGTPAFSDTDGHWAAGWLNTAAGCEVLYGDNGRASPDQPISRQEMSALLTRVLATPQTAGLADNRFNDINADTPQWAYAAVMTMATEGIVNGNPDGSFRPTAAITRAEAAKMLSLMLLKPLRSYTVAQRLGDQPITQPIVEPR